MRLQSFRGLRSVQQPLILLDVGVFWLGEKHLVSRGMHSFPCPPGQHPPRQAQAVVLRPLAAFVAATRTLYTSSPLLSATYPPAKAPSSRSTEMNIVRSTNGRTNKRVCPKPHLESARQHFAPHRQLSFLHFSEHAVKKKRRTFRGHAACSPATAKVLRSNRCLHIGALKAALQQKNISPPYLRVTYHPA